jgi:hypothetical protein
VSDKTSETTISSKQEFVARQCSKCGHLDYNGFGVEMLEGIFYTVDSCLWCFREWVKQNFQTMRPVNKENSKEVKE